MTHRTPDTDIVTTAARLERSAARFNRSRALVVTVVGAVAIHLLISFVGRALGGPFTHTQTGKATEVDATAVTLLSRASSRSA